MTDGAGRHYAVAESTGTIHPDVWGEAVSGYIGFRATGAVTKSPSFGEERLGTESAPGLSFFRNRVYDQETGRWTQEDPIGIAGGINLYQFNGNDPASYSDRYGLCPWCIGAVAGVVTGYAIAKLTGDDYDLKDAATDAALGAAGGGLLSKLGKLNRLRKAAGLATSATETTASVASKVVGASGEITGFTKHGINQVIQRGVKPGHILDAVKNATPRRLVDKAGRVSFRYEGDNATVVLNEAGKVVTAW